MNNRCKDTIDKYVNPEKPRPASTGNEVWRGASAKGKTAVTKASRDSSIDSSKVDERLPHGAEDASSGKSKAPFVLGTGISVPGNDKDLDGINFKENIRAPPIAESLMASQSPTPLRLQSPARGIPATGLKPSPLLFVRADLNTKGAGHASTASQAVGTVDSTALSSSLATPVQMHQQTSPPEPRPSAVKYPSGRVERYLAPLEQGSGGGDTELKGPLGLKNNNLEDKVFLRELDSKLLEAARSRTVELVGQINRSDNSADDLDLDQREPELQLKPSMNFGSPFGAPYCGKGIWSTWRRKGLHFGTARKIM